jgi:uncharacterized FAD-dependent dehydrogenase
MAGQSTPQRLKIAGLRLPVTDASAMLDALVLILDVPVERISSVRILRRSLDARQRTLHYEYSVAVDVVLNRDELTRVLSNPKVILYEDVALPPAGPRLSLQQRPIVVGAGPAGLFAALGLAERGCPPLVIERGGQISDRVEDVQAFWKQGDLNPESNVVFGEGGAGAFSDGKLTARGTSPFKQKVLEELVACGADETIVYDARPHLGTDRLRRVIPALVERLRKRGVEFHFNTRMDGITIEKGRLQGIRTFNGEIATGLLVLAVGHSARDTVRMLADRGMQLQPKGFAVGVRIVHPQALIDRSMRRNVHTSLAGAAEYSVKYADKVSGRGVYSFCMCPGGLVIGCSSQPNTLCVNGMSFSNRGGTHANAALVVTVSPDDVTAENALSGIDLQERIEQQAYAAGSHPFFAPVQSAADFISGQVSSDHSFADLSFQPGMTSCDFAGLLPGFIVEPLRRALHVFDKKIPGFIEQGVLVGVETRTSSPVRMVRDPENFQSVGIAGLIPVGEGAGYAGGIISSAVDGLRAAWSISC